MFQHSIIPLFWCYHFDIRIFRILLSFPKRLDILTPLNYLKWRRKMISGLMDTIVRNADSSGWRNAVASGSRGNRLLTDSQEAAPTAKNLFRTILVIIALAAIFHRGSANAGVPIEQDRSTGDQFSAILPDPSLKPESKQKERREQLRRIIFARFDFAEMAQRSLGSEWRRRTPEDKQE